MVGQAAPAVPAGGAGGLSAGRLGTNAEEVAAILRSVLAQAAGDHVIVLLDLGSAGMALEIALDELTAAERALVAVSEGPLVEGSVAAAVAAAGGAGLAQALAAAGTALDLPKLPRA